MLMKKNVVLNSHILLSPQWTLSMNCSLEPSILVGIISPICWELKALINPIICFVETQVRSIVPRAL